jgi:hypothetical protein
MEVLLWVQIQEQQLVSVEVCYVSKFVVVVLKKKSHRVTPMNQFEISF